MIKKTDSSDVYVNCISCCLSEKLAFVKSVYVVGKNPNTPIASPWHLHYTITEAVCKVWDLHSTCTVKPLNFARDFISSILQVVKIRKIKYLWKVEFLHWR